jgi:putative colanic acid biosynthesis UDP-glucose lipid carrier transferase
MVGRRIKLLRLFTHLLHVLCLFAAFWLALWLRFQSGWFPIRDLPRLPSYAGYAFLAAALWSLFSRYYRVDERIWEGQSPGDWIGAVWRATLAALAAVSLAVFFYREYSFSRVMAGLFWGLHLSLVLSSGFPLYLLRRRLAQTSAPARLLVLGEGEFADNLAGRLRAGGLAGGIPVQCSPEDPSWKARLDAGEFDEVLLAVPLRHGARLAVLLEELRHAHAPVRVALDLPAGGFQELSGVPVLDLASSPSDRLSYALVKRGFDLAVATAALVLGAPVAALVAVLVKWNSAGPVFFAQERVGANGRPFRMYKFRTLPVAPAGSRETEWSSTATADAGRLGRWLRRLRLDEWPQFWNVLRGEMSVVGPRPERAYFADGFRQVLQEYGLRHRLKAGITGWAQVHGLTGDTEVARRLEYDLYYLRHWSLALDLRILLMTVRTLGQALRE